MPTSERIAYFIDKSLYTADPNLVLSHSDALSAAKQSLIRAWNDTRQHNRPRVGGLISETVTLPWSEQPAHLLYCHLIETLDFDDLHTLVYQAPRNGWKTLQVENSLLADVVKRFQYPGSLIRVSGSEEMPLITALLKAYLAGSCSQADLRRLQLARNLALEDSFELLQIIWQCRQGLSPDPTLDQHTRLWIWLTHMENLLFMTPKERREVIKGLEYLVERTQSHLTLWLGIDTEETATVAEVKEALGTKLLSFLDADLTEEDAEGND